MKNEKVVKVSPKTGDEYAKAGTEYEVSIDKTELAKTVNHMVPVVYTDAAGEKVVKNANDQWVKESDGTTVVEAANIKATMQDANGNTTDPYKLTNVASSIADKKIMKEDPDNVGQEIEDTSASYLDKLTKANDLEPNNAVNVSDLKKVVDEFDTTIAGKSLAYKANGTGSDTTTLSQGLDFIQDEGYTKIETEGTNTGKVKFGLTDKVKNILAKAKDNGIFEYADENGKPLIKVVKEDGTEEYYKPDQIGPDGKPSVVEIDGKLYPAGTELVNGVPTKDGAEVEGVDKIDPTKVVIKAKGETRPVTNIKSTVGLNDKDANGTAITAPITAEAAQEAVAGENGLLKKTTGLNTAATVGDLQALAQAGLDFEGNAGGEVHRPLGTKLTIKGEGTTAALTNSAAGNISVEKDTTTDANGLVVKLAKDLKNIDSIAKGENGPKISLNDDNITLVKGTDPVKLTGVKAGEVGPNSTDAVNGSQLHKVQQAHTAVTLLKLNKDVLATKLVEDPSASKTTLEGGLDLSYAANDETAKKTSLTQGLKFKEDAGYTKVTTDATANGVVNIGLTDEVKDIINNASNNDNTPFEYGIPNKNGTGADPLVKVGNDFYTPEDAAKLKDAVVINGKKYPAGTEPNEDGTGPKDPKAKEIKPIEDAADKVVIKAKDKAKNVTNVKSTLPGTTDAEITDAMVPADQIVGADGTKVEKPTALGNNPTQQEQQEYDEALNKYNKALADAKTKLGDETARVMPELSARQKQNAATVDDVLNAGWNLQENDGARDFVKAYDTVNFVDGLGTTARVETDANNKISWNNYY